jgi:hypothetical protein
MSTRSSARNAETRCGKENGGKEDAAASPKAACAHFPFQNLPFPLSPSARSTGFSRNSAGQRFAPVPGRYYERPEMRPACHLRVNHRYTQCRARKLFPAKELRRRARCAPAARKRKGGAHLGQNGNVGTPVESSGRISRWPQRTPSPPHAPPGESQAPILPRLTCRNRDATDDGKSTYASSPATHHPPRFAAAVLGQAKGWNGSRINLRPRYTLRGARSSRKGGVPASRCLRYVISTG